MACGSNKARLCGGVAALGAAGRARIRTGRRHRTAARRRTRAHALLPCGYRGTSTHGWRSCVCVLAGGLVPAAELRPNPGMPRQAPPSCCNRHSDITPGAHRSTAPLGAHTGVPPLSDNVRSGSSARRSAPAAAQVDCGQRAALARPQPARERQPALVARVRPAQPELARPIRLEAAGRRGHIRPPAHAGRARRRAVLWRPVPPSARTHALMPARPGRIRTLLHRSVVRCGMRRKRDYRSREEALLRISSNQNSTRPRPHD
jgi:hypothetical protein